VPEEGGAAAEGGGGEAKAEEGGAAGPGATLQLAADPTQIAFDTTSLSSKPGKVTIEFDNPSAIEHDVAIEKDGDELAKSALVTEGKTSVTVDLESGTYTFLCTVPGHAEAGMEGTLTVK
jgi:plastocyanin